MGFSVWLALWLVVPGPADAYPRQPLDVEHYRFELTLSDTTDRIAGVATIRLRSLAGDLATISLDLTDAAPSRQGKGMQVSSVSRGDHPLSFRQAGDRLAITLDAPAAKGRLFEIEVHYSGIPADGLHIGATRHGDRSFFSDNWPDKARNWLPTIDHIGDKATMEMAVTAPAQYQVISNGLEIEETDLPGSFRRTVWRESVPISPWLYLLGAARFARQRIGEYHGIPLETWVFAQDRDAGFHDFAVPTRDVVAFYSEWIGPFSYEKLANVQSNAVRGGMEGASAISYSAESVTGTRTTRWRNVIIHEIAHQWFGDAVTERDWNDVWLSEGFATYFTLLFIEHAYGRDDFLAGLDHSRKTVIDYGTQHPAESVVRDQPADLSQVTSRLTYEKGGWVLHMLRERMGDDRFWAGIRDYYGRHQNGNASTAEFREAMERASGEDLSAFFGQWLYRGGIPRLDGSWHWDPRARQLTVELNQTQPGPAFDFSVDIGITNGNQERVETIRFTGASAHLTIDLPRAPDSVRLDPNLRLLFQGSFARR